METYGHSARTVEGRRVLQSLGQDMTLERTSVDTQYTVDHVRIQFPGGVESQGVNVGAFKRPYLDADVNLTAMTVDNNGTDDVLFEDKDRLKTRYRYQLSDAELIAFIENGLYTDPNFEARLNSVLSGETFVEPTELSVYSTKVEYEGAVVPFVVLDNIHSLTTNTVSDRQRDGRDDFGLMLSERMANFQQARVVSRETNRQFESEETFDLDVKEPDLEEVTELVHDIENQSDVAIEPTPVEPVAEELVDVNQSAELTVAQKPEGMRTLAEAQAEAQPTQTYESLEDEDVFGL